MGVSTILVSHLKEYQKAVKKHEKTPLNPVESLYKKSHPIYDVAVNKTLHSADHCTSILRIVFKELVPWELWDTPHSELLVRILSKKLDNFIDNTLAEPMWLNDKLLTILKGKNESKITEEKMTPTPSCEEMKTQDNPIPTSVEPALPSMVKERSPAQRKGLEVDLCEPPVANTIQNLVEEVPVMSTEPLDIKSSPVLRQRRGRQGRNEVKIYDRIIEGMSFFSS